MGVRGSSKYVGHRLHRLLVERVTYKPGERTQIAVCRCDCGRVIEVEMAVIRNGHRIACGACIPRRGSAPTCPETLRDALARIRKQRDAAEQAAIALLPPYQRYFDDLAIWREVWTRP